MKSKEFEYSQQCGMKNTDKNMSIKRNEVAIFQNLRNLTKLLKLYDFVLLVLEVLLFGTLVNDLSCLSCV